MHAVLMESSGVQDTVFSCHTAEQQETGRYDMEGGTQSLLKAEEAKAV